VGVEKLLHALYKGNG